MIWTILISLASIIYIWWIYALLLSKKGGPSGNGFYKTSIIIPCYNEEKDYLIQCVDSAMNTRGTWEVILVNNNSNKKGTLEAIKILKKKYKVLKVLNQPTQGKRFAHSKGLEHAEGDIIVFVDSDTILDEKAILELNKPFSDESIGGVAGQVYLANKNKNLLTRMIHSMFWTSGNIFRSATSTGGFMQVMPGCISAYRKSDLMKLEKDYLSQQFAGRQCNISDDRYLTLRMQTRLLKKIMFAPKAICYTFMPSTLLKFWKTLERWKRGVLREILLLWKEPNKMKNKLLFFDVYFNFLMTNLIFIPRIYLIYNLFFNFSWISVASILIWVFIMNIFHGAYMVVYKPSIILTKYLYALCYEFFWSFSYIHAWINIQKQGMWSTR